MLGHVGSGSRQVDRMAAPLPDLTTLTPSCSRALRTCFGVNCRSAIAASTSRLLRGPPASRSRSRCSGLFGFDRFRMACLLGIGLELVGWPGKPDLTTIGLVRTGMRTGAMARHAGADCC